MNDTPWSVPQGAVVGDRYEIGHEIGRGGMGVVYRGFDKTLQRNVAVKFLEPEHIKDEEAVSRFQREALSAGMIGHENICDVRDLGPIDNGAPYIVMELLQGESLSATLDREASLPADRAVEIVLQMLSALEAAHIAGIVHRDLKPENIFLATGSGGRSRVKLLDFGISKYLGNKLEGRLTKTGFVMGSPFYMSPEQARGRQDVDHRTDIWSVGVVLFELLIGSLPYDGENYNEVMARIITERPPDPKVLNPAISDALADVVLKALSEDPDDRFADAVEFASALVGATGRTALAEEAFGKEIPATVAASRDDGNRRRTIIRLALIAFAIVLLGVAAGVALGVWFPSESDSDTAAVNAPVEEPEAPSEAEPVAPSRAEGVSSEPPNTPSSLAKVSFEGLPAGAAVTFDGAPVEGNHFEGPSGQIGILEVKAAGFADLSIELALVDGLVLPITDRLRPAPAEVVTGADAGQAHRPRPQRRRVDRRDGGKAPSRPPREGNGFVHGRGGTKITVEYENR